MLNVEIKKNNYEAQLYKRADVEEKIKKMWLKIEIKRKNFKKILL